MITCSKCGKDNQDHYKFCLGCGAELPRDGGPKPFNPEPAAVKPAPAPVAHRDPFAAPVAAPAPVTAPLAAPPLAPVAPVSPVAVPPASTGPVAPPPGPAISGATAQPPGVQLACPQCGHGNAPANLFCGACGFRLANASAPATASRPPSAPAAPATAASGIVLTALRADGSEAGTYPLPSGTSTVGRETGGIFADDSYLSPRHATFQSDGGKLVVKDESSLNGVYRKLARDTPVELRPNDVFRIGQEIIKFEPLVTEPASPDGVERLGSPSRGYVGRIALVIGRDVTGNAFPIPESGVHLGRERGDVLFPEDGYVSGLHCRLAWDGGKLTLTDLGSSNGSFLRLREETELRSGDVLLMGQQLFRITAAG